MLLHETMQTSPLRQPFATSQLYPSPIRCHDVGVTSSPVRQKRKKGSSTNSCNECEMRVRIKACSTLWILPSSAVRTSPHSPQHSHPSHVLQALRPRRRRHPRHGRARTQRRRLRLDDWHAPVLPVDLERALRPRGLQPRQQAHRCRRFDAQRAHRHGLLWHRRRWRRRMVRIIVLSFLHLKSDHRTATRTRSLAALSTRVMRQPLATLYAC
jgi:hypothetical protein